MAFGISADAKLVQKFAYMCALSGSDDVMTRSASVNIVKLFWDSDPQLKQYHLKRCEKIVFQRLADKKRQCILVDGPHVEAYLTEIAHEITKQQREDPNIARDHPYVTLCKAYLEKAVRDLKIMINEQLGDVSKRCLILPKSRDIGQITEMTKDKGTNHEEADKRGDKSANKKKMVYKKPDMPKDMKKMYDIRKSMPIVTAKRDTLHKY